MQIEDLERIAKNYRSISIAVRGKSPTTSIAELDMNAEKHVFCYQHRSGSVVLMRTEIKTKPAKVIRVRNNPLQAGKVMNKLQRKLSKIQREQSLC